MKYLSPASSAGNGASGSTGTVGSRVEKNRAVGIAAKRDFSMSLEALNSLRPCVAAPAQCFGRLRVLVAVPLGCAI